MTQIVHLKKYLLISLVLVLASCNSGKVGENAISITPTNTKNPEPSVTVTPAPTMTPTPTSTPEYYSSEELMADGKFWIAEDFSWLSIPIGGAVGECPILPKEVAGKMNTSIFHLPKPGGNIVFNHKVFSRISQNKWVNESSKFDDINNWDIHISSDLIVSAGSITVTHRLSKNNEEATCTNIYTPLLDDSGLIPSPTSLLLPTIELKLTPGFYTKEEIDAQNTLWNADYYQTLELVALLNVENSDVGRCRFLAEDSDIFSKDMVVILPAPGEDLIINSTNYSRMSPNIWENELIIPSGLSKKQTIEFFDQLIIETSEYTSSTGETVKCVNEFMPVN